MQKRERKIDIEPDWGHLGTDENGIPMNSYFVDHPEMILGEMQMVSGRFGPEPSCVPYEGADLAEQLNEAIANIHGEVTAYEVDDELTEEDNSIPADPTVRNFSYTVVDDKIYFRENSRMAPVDVSATAESRIKGMITIRDAVRNLIELQTEDYPDYEIKAEQERLNTLYDTFTSKYGLLNSRANTSAFSQDSSYSLLSALEILDDEGNLERKADMFFKRTIKPHTPVTSVDTSSEALAVSMGEKAYVDMEYMCQLSGKTEEEIYEDLKGVIFLNPMYGYGNSTEAKYLMADEYLSGNVREKLAWAKRSAELSPDDYKIHVEALEKVHPKDLTASEISVRLGATWLPPEIVEQFIFEFLGPIVEALGFIVLICLMINNAINWTTFWLPQYIPEGGMKELETLAYMEEITGVHIEYEVISSEQRSTNFSVLLAADDLCDIMVGANSFYPGNFKLGVTEEEFFVNLYDYREYTPNYIYETLRYPDDIDTIKAAHAKGAELSIENATSGMTAPFHAGAAKYFAEQGVNVG